MADETVINGVALDVNDRMVDITGDGDHDLKVPSLMQKIAALEQEKRELVHENEVVRERINKFKDEIEALESDKAEMKSEIERFEADKKALESIEARATQLETEVSRLQHDLTSSMADGQDANAKLSELKRVVEDLRNIDSEKGLKLEVLEKERNLLLENIHSHKAAAESEGVEAEEERENQIRHFKTLVEELQSVIARNRVDMATSNKEREELEIVKNELEVLLKKSEKKVKEMEHKMDQLYKELEVSQKMISGMKEKETAADDIFNGKDDVVMDRDEEATVTNLKVRWPVLAVSAGAIAVVAVLYLRYVRQR